jgi:hypothetical protein
MSVASGGGSAYLEGNGVTLTNPTGSNIQGAGFIGDNAPVAIVNNGEILANVSGQTLVVNAGDGGVTNNNILEAENGGTAISTQLAAERSMSTRRSSAAFSSRATAE